MYNKTSVTSCWELNQKGLIWFTLSCNAQRKLDRSTGLPLASSFIIMFRGMAFKRGDKTDDSDVTLQQSKGKTLKTCTIALA